jgi:DNA-binding NtrC family response regulator
VITRRFSDLLGRLRKSGRESDRARLAAILELNRALARVDDRQALLRLLLDEAVGLFGAERGFVVLGSGADPATWTVPAARSLDREPVRSPERKLSSSIVARCLQAQEAQFCADAQEGDFKAAQSVADMRLRSVLCTPLVAGAELLGCIYLDHRFQSGAFAADDLPWLQAFADQAAIALYLHGLLEENRAYGRQLQQRNRDLEEQLAAQAEALAQLDAPRSRAELAHAYPDIVGRGPLLLRCLHLVDRVIPADFPVLICGESGTGKELLARAIHGYGPRAKAPFVAVNAAAIAPGLMESELFGHVRGAFTGAARDRPGLLAQAAGGVLFLDEITELDPDLQVKLLRFLEDPSVRPVGGERAQRIDLRVLAATNRDPRRALAEGALREDLYYRLAVVTIELPPLRERRGDIRWLVEHFLAQAAAERGALAPRRLTAECAAAMAARAWPGNLRQLRNEVLRLDALATEEEIGAALLSPETEPVADAATLDLQQLERWAVREALRRARGNKSEAARLLGISRRALYNKLDRTTDAAPGGA